MTTLSPRTLWIVTALVIPRSVSAQGTTYEQFQAFSGVLSHVRQNYVDSMDFGTLLQASIRGLLSSLDPHSHYVTRTEYLLRSKWNRGELASPGVRLENSADGVIVLSVTTAAAKAGVQPGDRLLRLNDTPLAGEGAEAVELRLLGDKGTKIRLAFERKNAVRMDTVSMTLKREPLEQRILSSPRLVAPRIAYLRLHEFTLLAPKELKKEIKKSRELGATQLLLDLRGNPGGEMEALSEIAAMFLPGGTEIFHTEGRRKSLSQVAMTQTDGEFVKLPLVLLIDAGSASAAEVLAGSFQDHDRALILGRRSFGKALVQTSLPLPNADMVLLTTARIVTPSGRVIQRRYRGLRLDEYVAGAGGVGASDDTLAVYRTARGREVRGGGGILPDIVLSTPPDLPVWFAQASDSGYDAVADTVAKLLASDPASRAAWMSDTAAWDSRLVTPFLAQVQAGLGVNVAPTGAQRARIGLLLAERAAFERWGVETAEELSIKHDPDIHAALAYFGRAAGLLREPNPAR